jgi:DNA-binding LacI/PurR family transcriptional regulator
LESGEKFTAAFVASDTVALGAKAAIHEHGLVIPKDIAIVGFDDLSFSRYLSPPLTTVHLPAVDLARRAAEMMIQLLESGKSSCRQVLLDTRLIVRKSCGAATS